MFSQGHIVLHSRSRLLVWYMFLGNFCVIILKPWYLLRVARRPSTQTLSDLKGVGGPCALDSSRWTSVTVPTGYRPLSGREERSFCLAGQLVVSSRLSEGIFCVLVSQFYSPFTGNKGPPFRSTKRRRTERTQPHPRKVSVGPRTFSLCTGSTCPGQHFFAHTKDSCQAVLSFSEVLVRKLLSHWKTRSLPPPDTKKSRNVLGK